MKTLSKPISRNLTSSNFFKHAFYSCFFGSYFAFILLLVMFAAPAIANLEQKLSCPVCHIDYQAIVADIATGQLAIDGQPFSSKLLPLPECPLCGGVFANLVMSERELQKLKDFVWAPEQRNGRKTDTRLRFARLLEYLERDAREVGMSYLQAAWANSHNQQLAKECREKSLTLFKEYLDSSTAEDEYRFDISLKIADILRQLQRFNEAEEWLQQMQGTEAFQQAWYPMLINHTLELVNRKDSEPALLPTGNSLHEAINTGNIKELATLASKKSLLHEIDTAGMTPLTLAISLNNNAAARLLLQAGADPQQKDTGGNSALHKAAQRNNREILQLLLQGSNNADPVNQLGKTPLHLAIETMNPQIAGMLINAGASLNRKDANGNNLIHMICRCKTQQYEKILETLLKNISDVNQRNHDSMTPLHVAAISGSANMLRLLTLAGAKIDARLANGNSALFFCRPELIETLLELGANMELKNNAGLTAFVNARLNADQPRIAAFKKTGRFGQPTAKFDIRQVSTSVFELANTGKNDDLELLLDKNPEQLNARESTLGETPLHFAAAANQATTVELLISRGAEINASNDFLRTPLHYAATMGHLATGKLLCAAKANIHALDSRGSTPLHDTAAAGHKKFYNYLLQLGASDSTLDNQGRSAASLLENSSN